ncbi:hypothetical protein [Devosia ginsengisoli]|nr:hypothetical protein [Devosia ginsengisoli]MCR6672209.1 hypothetical protein [Devosia ginsengisoli]
MSVARNTNTPIDQVEEWEIDKLISYSKTLSRQLARERGKKRQA